MTSEAAVNQDAYMDASMHETDAFPNDDTDGRAHERPDSYRSALTTETGVRRHRHGLRIRHVTRMTPELNVAVLQAARRAGVTGSTYVRRLLLDRVAMISEEDARSGRPVRDPDADRATIAAAIRELAAVSAAIQLADMAGAKEGLDRARHLLIPIVVARAAF